MSIRLCDDCRDTLGPDEFMTAETWSLVDQMWNCEFDRAGARLAFDLVELDEDLMGDIPPAIIRRPV